MPAIKQLWHIYFVDNCRHVKPKPKGKLVVIIHIDQTALGCFINSNVNDWIVNHNLLVCEAKILAKEHIGPLNQDSFVDCNDIYPFENRELTADRGLVSTQAKKSILQAIRDCPTIPRKYKNAILARDGNILDDTK